MFADNRQAARPPRVCRNLRLPTALEMKTVERETARGFDGSRGAANWLLLAGIRFYQAVFSHLMPVGCKFYPSCSHYAAEAIERHGASRGAWLALARLWRCRPFTQGGFDPVPDADEAVSNPAMNPETIYLFHNESGGKESDRAGAEVRS